MGERIACYGCGALVDDTPGTPHKYLGAAWGCWEIFGQVLAREYSAGALDITHRLTVDAYSLQHPGTPGRQTIQSMNVHLVSLHLILERGATASEALLGIRRTLKASSQFVWFEPPVPNGTTTVLDVAPARDMDDHKRLVDLWARDVWQAWSGHHDHVREFARRNVGL